MTLLLASVTGPEEAALVLAHGADIIDLKDASQGALGALPPEVVRATVAAVRGRRPVSAVIGDLPMEPDVIAAAVESTAKPTMPIKVNCSAESSAARNGTSEPPPRILPMLPSRS